jgi:hypothetical protein
MDRTKETPNAICLSCKKLTLSYVYPERVARTLRGDYLYQYNGMAEKMWSCKEALPGRLAAQPLGKMCLSHEPAAIAHAPPLENIKIKIEKYRKKKPGNLIRKGSW